jgi:hypothetical protein
MNETSNPADDLPLLRHALQVSTDLQWVQLPAVSLLCNPNKT